MATPVFGRLKARATETGLAAGLLALMLWPCFVLWPAPMRLPFAVALAACCVCGLALLALGTGDLFRFSRGTRVWPARMFDLVLGLTLAGPAAAALAGLA